MEISVYLGSITRPPTFFAATYNGRAANTTGMSDVESNAFYTAAVNWAVAQGYITGYAGTGTFGPNDRLSAEMLCVILCRIQKVAGDASAPEGVVCADEDGKTSQGHRSTGCSRPASSSAHRPSYQSEIRSQKPCGQGAYHTWMRFSGGRYIKSPSFMPKVS
ncbi:MAG: S-layer homology domain-containing protein [Coriobacteriia bacterium]|nr:S-layer homology domain-containing protein [Coriobacteriia bacterium]